MLKHWFWNLMSAAVILWYSTITVYVGIRGWKDIKDMLSNLAKLKDGE